MLGFVIEARLARTQKRDLKGANCDSSSLYPHLKAHLATMRSLQGFARKGIHNGLNLGFGFIWALILKYLCP
jgi:hypothetical protein